MGHKMFFDPEAGKVLMKRYLGITQSFWMTQKKIAELFGVQRPAITKHLKNIFESNELEESSVSSKMDHTAEDDKTYLTSFYNVQNNVH